MKASSKSKIGIIVLMAVLLEVISAIQYYYSRNLLEEELEQSVVTALRIKKSMLRHTLNSAEQTMREHVWDIRSCLNKPDSLLSVTNRIIENNDKVVGACLAFVPNYYPEKGRLFEPYTFQDKDVFKNGQLAENEDHDYTLHPAFQRAIKEKKAFWSEPYLYQTNNETKLLTTYSYPLLNERNGQLIAVCGIDVSLFWLGDTLNSFKIYSTSFDLLLTGSGQMIAGPLEENVSANRVAQVVSLLNDSTVERHPTKNKLVNYIEFYDEEQKDQAYIYYSSMVDDPYWQVALVCYEKEAYGKMGSLTFYIALLMLLAFIVLGVIIQRFIHNMIRLQRADLEQEHINKELLIAQHIQNQMLPKQFPPYPDRNDVDIYGVQHPAKAVGGDLFDFFLRDEKLVFCIGDVSGKGIPSAMVMSQTHSLFRIASAHDNNPASVMQNINEVMTEGNRSNMFITLFIGILDLPTGHLRYCNAGHDKPIVIEKSEQQSENCCHILPAEANLPVGVFADVNYVMQEMQLHPQEMLFLYTDGLTEAKNTERKMFGIDRVKETLATSSGDCKQMIENIQHEAIKFIGEADQSDDLTMLGIRYTPQGENDELSEQITLNCDLKQTRKLNDFMKAVTARIGIGNKQSRNLRLAVEEAVTNVMNYAYPIGQEGKVMIEVKSNQHSIKIVISDEGVAFDPTEVGTTDVTLSAEDRPIGGLGILLVREMVDSVNYERTNGKNILTLRMNILPDNP